MIQVSEETMLRIHRVAQENNLSIAQLIEEALARYLSWREHQKKLWDDTIVAINQMEAGEGIPSQEIFDWLDTWGATSP